MERRFTLGGPGQNRLSLTAPLPLSAGELTQLELDLTGRAGEPATRRRGRVQRAELVIDEARLNRELAENLSSLLPLLPLLPFATAATRPAMLTLCVSGCAYYGGYLIGGCVEENLDRGVVDLIEGLCTVVPPSVALWRYRNRTDV